MDGFVTKSSFNTQPPEGGWVGSYLNKITGDVSTHSRLKAAGISAPKSEGIEYVSTHSRLKAAGECEAIQLIQAFLFQHTAA